MDCNPRESERDSPFTVDESNAAYKERHTTVVGKGQLTRGWKAITPRRQKTQLGTACGLFAKGFLLLHLSRLIDGRRRIR